MYALPGQTQEGLLGDLRTALGFRTTHLSVYQLTLEPNTFFAKYPPVLPDDDTAAVMQVLVEAETAAAGLEHYEVSAYARPGRRARHNLNYWQFGDYLGVGAGAHSKISFPHRIVRQVRFKNPGRYLHAAGEESFIAEGMEVTRKDLPFEFMLNVLRLGEGFPPTLFSSTTGLPPTVLEAGLRKAEEKGLLTQDHAWIKPTALGRRFLSDLQEIFLTDA
jgi:coproporphyrinogen III oxidase-like Fe-S oxidoreductase